MTTEWSQGFGSIVPGPRVETGCGNEVLDMAIAPPKCLDISKRLLAGGRSRQKSFEIMQTWAFVVVFPEDESEGGGSVVVN